MTVSNQLFARFLGHSAYKFSLKSIGVVALFTLKSPILVLLKAERCAPVFKDFPKSWAKERM